jgi:peptidyl-prolyl cis-trans isomerase SurA
MKRLLSTLIIVFLCAFAHTVVFGQDKLSATVTPPANSSVSTPVNGIAIVVNDEVVTKMELADRTKMVVQRLKQQGVPLPSDAELQKQVIERLITEKAELQLAHDSGMRVDDVMLDRAMQRMAEQNKMSLQVFRNQIEKEGTPYSTFREGVRDDILLQRIKEREVDSKVQVSESEIDNYLAAQKEDKQKNIEVELSHILIRIPETASPEMLGKLKAKADYVLQQVKSGGDFSKLAATYSDSAEGLKGGSLGWREQDRYPQLFIDAFSNLKEGQTTGLIKSGNGFHILKLTGRRTVEQSAGGIPQAHVRHILIKITPTVTKEQAIHKLVDFKGRIENNTAKFEDLAQQFSNDSSASKGGDLGWLYVGDIPEFDATIAALKDGEISDPIESPNGMHIIQVLGRKSDEMSKERQRQLARQVIRARKLDEASLDWVRQLRDRAYVEIRVDDANK